MRTNYALFSGGFDSSLALFMYLHDNPPMLLKPVFFLYGQKMAKQEVEAVMTMTETLKKYAADFGSSVEDCRVVDIGEDNNHVFSWSRASLLSGTPNQENKIGLENRNMVLISCLISSIMAEIDTLKARNSVQIVTGFTNNFYDTNIPFINALNELIKSMRFYIEVKAPLIAERQKQATSPTKLGKLAYKYDVVPFLTRSWSCYFPKNDGNTCGECGPCKKRRIILEEARMKRAKNKPKQIRPRRSV